MVRGDLRRLKSDIAEAWTTTGVIFRKGWLLDIASRNWKLDKNDRFGLLIACCRDCIGDVSVREVSDEV